MIIGCEVPNNFEFCYRVVWKHNTFYKLTTDSQVIYSILFLCPSDDVTGSCGLANILSNSVATFLGKQCICFSN